MKTTSHILSIVLLADISVTCVSAQTKSSTGAQAGRAHSRTSRSVAGKPAAQTIAPKTAPKPAPAPPAPKQDQTIALLGEFQKPGIIRFTEGMTVKDAVAAVGGFTPAAESASITLRRVGAEALASIDGAKAVADDLVQNAILSPGDVLVVAAKKTAEAPSPTPPAPDQAGTVQQAAVSVAVPVAAPPVDEDVPVLVEGAVERPGMYIYSRMPLRQVFEQVGGLKKEADRGKIVIYRGSAADPASAKQIKYDLGKIEKGKAEDIELEPGDVIQVPMKKKGLWDRIGDTFRKMGTRSLLGGIPLVGPVIGSLSGG